MIMASLVTVCDSNTFQRYQSCERNTTRRRLQRQARCPACFTRVTALPSSHHVLADCRPCDRLGGPSFQAPQPRTWNQEDCFRNLNYILCSNKLRLPRVVVHNGESTLLIACICRRRPSNLDFHPTREQAEHRSTMNSDVVMGVACRTYSYL
jgi:hypothetical protein